MLNRLAAALMASFCLTVSGVAHAACVLPMPPAFSIAPRLDTMTSDAVKIAGGCIDGTPIGENKPSTGHFTNLIVDGTIAGAGIPIVADNAELASKSTLDYPTGGVIRLTSVSGSGAPPLYFVPLTGNCVANGLVNDIGSCVDSANGAAFKAIHPAEGADVRQWGCILDGVFDCTTAANAALTAVPVTIIPAGNMHVTDRLVCSSAGPWPVPKHKLIGVGYYASVITVGNAAGNDFNMAASGVIKLGTDSTQPGCQIDQIGVWYYQPNTGGMTISDIIQYPTAIDASNVHSVSIGSVRITNAWKCLDMTGAVYAPGGSDITHVECSSYNLGFDIDNATSPIHIGNWLQGLYGLDTNQGPVYISQGESGAALVGRIGRCDGCVFDSIVSFSQGLHQIATSAITGALISNLALDSDGATIINDGGILRIGKWYHTASTADTQGSIRQSAGHTVISTAVISAAPTSVPDTLITGGRFSLGSGIMLTASATHPISVTGGIVDFGNVAIDLPTTLTTAAITVTGGTLMFRGTAFNVGVKDQSFPAIKQSSTGCLDMDGTTFNQSNFTGIMVVVDNDTICNNISNITLKGWQATIPVTAVGYYDLPDNPIDITSTPEFETNGDFSPLNNTVVGKYYRRGDYVEYDLNDEFDTNAYTTASGYFQMATNMPNPIDAVPTLIGNQTYVTFGASEFPGNGYIVGGGHLTAAVRPGGLKSNAGAFFYGTTNIVPNKTGIKFSASGRYRVR